MYDSPTDNRVILYGLSLIHIYRNITAFIGNIVCFDRIENHRGAFVLHKIKHLQQLPVYSKNTKK